MSRRFDSQEVQAEVEAMRASLNKYIATVQKVVRKSTDSQRRLRLNLNPEAETDDESGEKTIEKKDPE